MEIAKNCIVSIDYTLTNDKGELLDSSPEGQPLVYLHGAAGIIPGLEKELSGKAVGEEFEVTLTPEEGFGERRPDMIQTIPRNVFPEPEQVQPGMYFNAQSNDGQQSVQIVVTEVTEETVTVDGNHPLAGMTLTFHGTVQAVRPASEEELAEGHPL